MRSQFRTYLFVGITIGTIALILIIIGASLFTNPTNTNTNNSQNQNSTPISVVKTNLATPQDKLAIADPFKVTFSAPISLAVISISIQPKTQLTATVEGNTLSLIPQSGVWNFNKSYKVTIKPVENSLLQLDKTYGLRFTTYPFTGM